MAEHADVRRLTERLASASLVDTLQDASGGQLGARHAALRSDRGRLELLMGRWMAEEITAMNQDRLARGLSPLDDDADRRLRAVAYAAETLGAGPLEPFMRDPAVEEIDVNSAASTFVFLLRRAQDRRRAIVGVGRRPRRLPEPPDPFYGGVRGPPRRTEPDGHPPSARRFASRHGARRADPLLGSPRTRASPSADSPCTRSGSTGLRRGHVPDLAGASARRVSASGDDDAGLRRAGRRQDDAAAWRPPPGAVPPVNGSSRSRGSLELRLETTTIVTMRRHC